MTRRLSFVVLGVLLVLPAAGRGAEEGSFDSNGVRIHYRVEGEGEPVVLVHGFAVNAPWQWGVPGITRALAKDYQVITFDCRGHGRSGKPTDPKKYGTEMVEDVVRLLDHLKIRKAHVVGYSMGAVITGKLVASHPDRLLSATLGGAGAIRRGTDLKFVDELADSLEQGKGMGPLVVALTPAGRPKPSPLQIEQVNRLLVRDNGKALAACVRGWKALAVSDEQLKANKVPTLALIGSLDPLKQGVDDIKDRMSNLRVVVLAGGDHVTAFTDGKFLGTLRRFLHDHAARANEEAPAGAGK